MLDTNASNVGLGAALSRVLDGQEKVIAYFSKVLSNKLNILFTDYDAPRLSTTIGNAQKLKLRLILEWKAANCRPL